MRDIIPIAIFFAGAAVLLLFYKRFRFGSTMMQQVCIGYALIISMMVGKAAANCWRKPDAMLMVALIGSVMFFISDMMLALYKFARMPRICDILCLAFYYPGQCMLGFSAYMHINRAVKD